MKTRKEVWSCTRVATNDEYREFLEAAAEQHNADRIEKSLYSIRVTFLSEDDSVNYQAEADAYDTAQRMIEMLSEEEADELGISLWGDES